MRLVAATEAESAVTGRGAAPWYYDELATIYRRQGDPSKELAILERFAAQQHGPGVTPPRLLERLEDLRGCASN